VLQTAAGGYLTEATRQQMTRMVERALVHYCRSSGRRDVKGVLQVRRRRVCVGGLLRRACVQPEAWFDSKVNHALERLVRSQQEAAASTAAAAAAAAVAATPPLAPTAAPPSSASSRVTPTRTVQLDDAY
jgi:hypothetical protein